MNYREKMREYLKEPNEICNHYGKWGILNKEQRDLITRLLNEMDRADNYIKKLQQENEQLKEVIEEVREYLTSYSSIHTIQFGTEEDSLNDIELNKMLDNKSITEMTYRYLKVHDKLLQILDKVKD